MYTTQLAQNATTDDIARAIVLDTDAFRTESEWATWRDRVAHAYNCTADGVDAWQRDVLQYAARQQGLTVAGYRAMVIAERANAELAPASLPGMEELDDYMSLPRDVQDAITAVWQQREARIADVTARIDAAAQREVERIIDESNQPTPPADEWVDAPVASVTRPRQMGFLAMIAGWLFG